MGGTWRTAIEFCLLSTIVTYFEIMTETRAISIAVYYMYVYMELNNLNNMFTLGCLGSIGVISTRIC